MKRTVKVENYSKSNEPFLSIVTRHHRQGAGRIDLLHKNLSAINRLKQTDFEHVIIVDQNSSGIRWANRSFGLFKHYIHGQWVIIVDDDDQIIERSMIQILKQTAQQHNPDIIRVKMKHSKYGEPGYYVWPSPAFWGTTKLGKCGAKGGFSSFVVKRPIWCEHIDSAGGPWGGDYRFIKSLYNHKPPYNMHWLNRIFTRTNQIGGGV